MTTNTKVVRKDVISQKEFDGMLAKADALKYVKEYYRMRDKAVICTFKAFGKRRGEIAWLEVADLQIVGDNLSVTFTLEKKRKKLLMAIRSEKQIPLSDPLTEPIVEYWNWMKRNHPECKYLFPTTFYSGLTGAMTFKKDRHLSGRQILRIVKKLNDMAWCFPLGEKVYTQNLGPQPVQTVQIGTKLYGDSEVIYIFKREFEGQCVEIKPKFFPKFTVTDSHPILTRQKTRKCVEGIRNVPVWSEPKWITASALLKDDPKQFFVAIPIEKKEEDMTFKLLISSRRARRCIIRKNQTIPLNSDFAYFLGWYVADGYCSLSSRHITLYLNADADLEEIPKLKTIIEKCFKRKASFWRRRRKEGRLEFSMKGLQRLLETNFGRIQRERHLPSWLFKAKREVIISFMDGYVAGDGCSNGKNFSISSCSEILVRQIQMLLLKIGIFASYRERLDRNRRIHGEKIKDSMAYILQWVNRAESQHCLFEEERVWVRLFKSELKPYIGTVYNFQTSNAIIATPVITHNCHLFRETAGAEIVRADRSIMAAFKVMLRLDLEDEATALGYVRRYAVDVIDRGVSDEQKDEIRKILAEAALTEKQRRVLVNVLSRL